MPTAFRVKEEILRAISNANVELIKGSGGDFIVKADEQIIFSKKDIDKNRFPNDGEIIQLLKQI